MIIFVLLQTEKPLLSITCLIFKVFIHLKTSSYLLPISNFTSKFIHRLNLRLSIEVMTTVLLH